MSGYERRFDLDLLEEPHQPLQKRALFSYIVHPFSITPDDPRFLRHNNILYAQEIVRVLNRVGYRVDVIDYRNPLHFLERIITSSSVMGVSIIIIWRVRYALLV